jgi:hypothetical protein
MTQFHTDVVKSLLRWLFLALFEGGAFMLLPSSPQLGWVLITAGVIVGIALAIWEYVGRKRRNSSSNLPEFETLSRYVPLPEAAHKVYEALVMVNDQHFHVVRAESGNPDDIDRIYIYFSIAISLKTDVYGKQPPSAILKKISKDEIPQSGMIYDGGNKFKPYGREEAKYIDLAVKRGCLSKVIDALNREDLNNHIAVK